KLIGTCTTCHDTPNGGNHSVVAPLNIGLADAARRTKDMPLYTLRNKATGETVQVTDLGRALTDGKWSHIGRFKGPMLRSLAPRARDAARVSGTPAACSRCWGASYRACAYTRGSGTP
ncbi:MAG TPA: hypothetical protein VGD37_23445, partial [Kofleriaceae bacterium]